MLYPPWGGHRRAKTLTLNVKNGGGNEIIYLDDEIIEKDKTIQKDLEGTGFHVLRFKDEEVLDRIDMWIIEIEKCIEGMTGS